MRAMPVHEWTYGFNGQNRLEDHAPLSSCTFHHLVFAVIGRFKTSHLWALQNQPGLWVFPEHDYRLSPGGFALFLSMPPWLC